MRSLIRIFATCRRQHQSTGSPKGSPSQSQSARLVLDAVSWSTVALSDRQWKLKIKVPAGFGGDVVVHFHPVDGKPLRNASIGKVDGDSVVLSRDMFANTSDFDLDIS